MARIRTIKPEFFTSGDIVSLTPLARLFYVSLWCEADREGRMEWKPMTLKLRYFPADSCSIEEMADELIQLGMIVLYEVCGKKYALIPSFTKHQVINNREAGSDIPPPPPDVFVTREARVKAEGRKEGKGKEGRKELCQHAEPVDEFLPDKPALPDCPHETLIQLFGKHLPELPQPQLSLWAGARAKDLRSRWRWVLTARRDDGQPYARTADDAVQWFDRFFAYVAQSDFLTGRSGGWTGCDLGWLAKADNFAKVVSGNYENRRAAA